ncbi:hypothetical protein B0T22DRAFT_539997 [Podospora appendiculata]|uniref:Short-chain dehydrogenases/reductase n=1 Tax=Podospora appendiculata TaxID=314037 RepID=A0AAE1C7H6_9PEZI|nr:hypothetical protein B0T22DRAFT_539997 [Podospora appendiculata]
MVALEQIRASNGQIATALRPGLVAVFAGATSGIGEATLKQFAKQAVRPRIYFIGRSGASGKRVRDELVKLNPGGEYTFLSVDVSLLRAVDQVCREIKAKETAVNLLFLSTGTMLGAKETEEGLNYPIAVTLYARLRFLVNLLPLLQNATDLRRVVTVLAGTKEGPVDTSDFQGRHMSLMTPKGRGHFSSMLTLALETAAQRAPSVAFVHAYPGFVKTNLGYDLEGVGVTILRGIYDVVYPVVGPLFATPVNEAGERHLFLATSARFSEAGGSLSGVPLAGGVGVAKGTDGRSGSGVYSVNNSGEPGSAKVEQLLGKLRKQGVPQEVWAEVEGEFVRVTGTAAV